MIRNVFFIFFHNDNNAFAISNVMRSQMSFWATLTSKICMSTSEQGETCNSVL